MDHITEDARARVRVCEIATLAYSLYGLFSITVTLRLRGETQTGKVY